MLSQQESHGNNACVKTILVLAANPKNTSSLRLGEEVREIDEGLRRASQREQFRLEQKWAVRQRDFYRAILDYQPQIVHFSGHGTGSDGIVLEDETDLPVQVNALALTSMFKLFATKGVECVLLNACYSEVQAKAISQHVNYVIGMNQAVGDKAAIAFSVAFYDALAAGEQMEFAYELGCSQLVNYLEQQTPVLFKKDPLSIIQPFVEIIPPNPYQELAAFGEKDADFFFGRETFVNGLVEAVNKQPLVGVIGPSGSGKSSVVYAGLIPKLRITGNWLIESFRPGNQPFYQLASALVHQLVPEIDEIQQLQSAAVLDKNIKQGLVPLEQITSRIIERNPGKRLLLFVDQFEELYTLCPKEEQECFADLMLQAIHQNNLTLVFTLRADFYGFVLACRPLRDALQQFAPQLLSAMNREELQRTIEQPAQKIEVQLEAQLTQRILDDVGNEPGNLPLLEFALARLWSLQQNRLLTHQAYDEIGGVKKALANHAEQIYQQLNEQKQQIAQRIFVQLIRPGEGTEDTRRIATRKEVGDENWGLVSYLAGYKARLVVTGRDEKSGEDTVEVVHEALIREWQTLREWMNTNRQFRVWQEQLRAANRQWEATNQDEGSLLRGAALAEAEEKLKEHPEDLIHEKEFIERSIQERERQEEEEKARRQREIRIAWIISGGSFVALLITAGLGLMAFYQWTEAQKDNILTLVASARANFVAGQQLEGMIDSLRAEQQSHDLLFGREEVADQVVGILMESTTDIQEHNRWRRFNKIPDKNLWKGTNNHMFTVVDGDKNESKVKLWDASGKLTATINIQQQHLSRIAFSPERHLSKIAFSPERQQLVTGGYDGTIKLWDISGRLIKTLPYNKNGYSSVAFSSNGRWLATSSGVNSPVTLWNTTSKINEIDTQQQVVFDIAFSPDNQHLATAGFDHTVKLWSILDNSSPIAIFKTLHGRVSEVAFTPDGSRLLTYSSDDGTTELWNLKGNEIATITVLPENLSEIAFGPDGLLLTDYSKDRRKVKLRDTFGKTIATIDPKQNDFPRIVISSDGQRLATINFHDQKVKLWDTSAKLIATINPQKGSIQLALDPHGTRFATVGDKGTIQWWDDKGKLIATFNTHQKDVYTIAFSPDGQRLAILGQDGVQLWDDNGRLIATPNTHQKDVYRVAFSPDGQRLAIGELEGEVQLWNVKRNTTTRIYTQQGIIDDLKFSPNGQWLVTCSQLTDQVKLWDAMGNLIATLNTHQGHVYRVAFSPDGQRLATSGGGMVKLWQIGGEKELLIQGCNDLRDYLNNPNTDIPDNDKHLCDGIGTQK